MDTAGRHPIQLLQQVWDCVRTYLQQEGELGVAVGNVGLPRDQLVDD